MRDPLDWAWAGGFIDGEGCVTIARDGRVRLIATQRQRRPLDHLQSLIGGNIHESRTRACFELTLGRAGELRLVLTHLYPHLRTCKKEQVQVALAALSELRKPPRDRDLVFLSTCATVCRDLKL